MKMKTIAKNKKARHLYHFLESYEAGIQLLGTEVKSLRQGAVSIVESYCRFINGELYLINANIGQYSHGAQWNHDPMRERKLLLHKKQLIKIYQKVREKGLTIVPTKIYFNDSGIVKVEIVLAKGKKLYDRREDMIKREQERKIRRKEDR
ncbi:MAG: SsrA-binding protein SmpB [Kosmotogaceae bacterium]